MEARILNLELPTLGTGNNPRSPGLHLSDVIRDILKASGIEPVRRQNWNSTTTMSSGFIWEEVLFTHWEGTFSRALAALLGRKLNWFQTGELHLDGITGTPDGVEVSRIPILQEAKFTWKSTKKAPPDRLDWMIQAKGYLKMLALPCTGEIPDTVMFHVFYCMGDYKGSGPIYQPWLITFQPAEIEENWQMIKNHAVYMGTH